MLAPRYREHAPSEALAPWVESYWSLRAPASDAPWPRRRVLPDGCIDVLFDLEGETRWVGTMTHALEVEGRGAIDIVGVRFRPGAARVFLGAPAVELTDAARPIERTLGEVEPLLDTLRRARSAEARIGAVERALSQRLAATRIERDRAVGAGIDLILSRGGVVDLRTLERRLGWSERQIERRFLAEVGIGPKRFARIVRFRRMLARASGIVERGAWADLALELGYSDQSHVLRDARELGGAPLRELIAGERRV